MPHEGADNLSRGDDPVALQERSLQLAEVFLAHQVIDRLFDMGIHRLDGAERMVPIADNNVDPSYVSGPTSTCIYRYDQH